MIATVNGKGNGNSAEFRGIFLLTDACSTMSRWNGLSRGWMNEAIALLVDKR